MSSMRQKTRFVVLCTISCTLLMGLAPQPLSQYLNNGGEDYVPSLDDRTPMTPSERGIRIPRNEPNDMYLIKTTMGAIEFELSKLRSAIYGKDRPPVAHVKNSVDIISYLVAQMPYSVEMKFYRLTAQAQLYETFYNKVKGGWVPYLGRLHVRLCENEIDNMICTFKTYRELYRIKCSKMRSEFRKIKLMGVSG